MKLIALVHLSPSHYETMSFMSTVPAAVTVFAAGLMVQNEAPPAVQSNF